MWSCGGGPPVPYQYMILPPQLQQPLNYHHHASTYSAAAGMVGLQMVPFNTNNTNAVQPLYDNGRQGQNAQYTLGSRRFFLDRSLYDLVKTSQYVESTDPKLLCWYLSLSTSDRKLIQDEGGLQHFLQRHPALEVRVREYTCVNFDAEDHYASHPAAASNARATLNDLYSCLGCGEKLWPGDQCKHCTAALQKETTSLPVITRTPADRESDLHPGSVTDTNLSWLEYPGGGGTGTEGGAGYQPGRDHHQQQNQNLTADAPAYVQDVGFPTTTTTTAAYGKYPRFQLGPPGQHPPGTDAAVVTSQDTRLWAAVYNNSSHLVKEPIRRSDMEAHTSKVQLMSQLWDEEAQKDSSGCSFVTAYKDPSAQASFSLDVELDSRAATKLELVNNNRPAMTHAQSGYCQYGDTSTLSWTNMAEDDDGTNATTAIGGEEEEPPSSVCDNSDSEHFHSIMEEDESILECKRNPRGGGAAVGGGGANSGQGNSPKVMVSIDALMGKTSQSEKTTTSSSSTAAAEVVVVRCSTAEKSTSTSPPPPPIAAATTRDASVVTESNMASCRSVATETAADTADKCVNTAVYMSDLDYLMEVFTRLRSVEVEFKELKAKMTRSGEPPREDADATRACCGCADRAQRAAERAQRAELSLLALQYRMCQQHCWRCYYNYSYYSYYKAERDWFTPPGAGPQEMDKYRSGSQLPVPAKLASVLKTLESDYNEMRRKIQAGDTLEQLTPLSVSYTLGPESCYVPAKIVADTLGNVPSSSSSQQPQRQDGKAVRGNVKVPVGICTSSQEKKEPAAPQMKVDHRAGGSVEPLLRTGGSVEPLLRAGGSVEPLLPQQGGTSSGPGDKQTCELQGLNTSEAWYDAEEDLVLDPSAGRRVSLLQVNPNPPSTVTEADVTSSSSSGPGPSEVPLKPQTPKTDSSNAAVKMIPQVCVVPTARCTFVPQHYGTMGSFDTLMARLKERHPGAGSQAIVGALKEVRVKRGAGVLRGLPLREIENMASELLAATAAAPRTTTMPPP